MKFIFPFLIIVSLLLTGCDPLRRINMKNRSGGEAMIIWTIKTDSINSSPFFLSSDTEVKFELKAEKPQNEIYMSFGVGTWTPTVLNKLVDDLESLVIRWNHHELKIESEDGIKNFLMPRRKGLGKRKIEITIRD